MQVQMIDVCVCLVSMLKQWNIKVPLGERISLTFTSFDLVPEVCGDFVQVYDGDKGGSSSTGKHDIMHDFSMQRGVQVEGNLLLKK